MTVEQKRLVTESLTTLKPVADLLGDIFYSRLFEMDPMLKYLFPSDMNHQGEKLIAAVNQAAACFDGMETLESTMQEFGLRHAGYGVKDYHYDTAEQALLWTVRVGMGAAFTVDVRHAWVSFYGEMAAAMKRGAAKRIET